MTTRGRRAVWVALLLYLVLLGAIGLWVTTIDDPVRDQIQGGIDWAHSRGVSQELRYGYVEAGANFLIFVPLGFLVALLLRPSRWWLAGALGVIVSAGIEISQLVLLSARTADEIDLLMNSAGAFAGAALARVVHLLLARRRRARSVGAEANRRDVISE